jgi:RHS repeat-associated protein
MQYDGLGQRLEMTAYGMDMSITTRYVVDPMLGAQPLTATAEGNTNVFLYGLGPIAEQTDAWTYPLSDGTNTPRQMTDQAGTVTLTGSYTPWGDVLDYTGEGNFTWGYFGGMMDASTGLLYVGNGQYYDPATGRFLTREAQPGSTNPYVPWGGDTIGAMLAPLALLGMFYSRKRSKGDRIGYLVIFLFVTFMVSTTLSACGQIQTLPPPQVIGMTWTPAMPATPTAMQNSTPTQTSTLSGVGRTIYLTFDDGPDLTRTPQILNVLQKNGAQATFFVTGADPQEGGMNRIIATCEEPSVPAEWRGENVLKLIKDYGNKIGVHGMYHGSSDYPQYYWNSDSFDPLTYITDEVNAINEALASSGYSVDPLIRAPGGLFPDQVIPGYEGGFGRGYDYGYTGWYYYGWTVDSGDSPGSGISPDQIIDNILIPLKAMNLPDSPIILLHSINSNTVKALLGETESKRNLIGALTEIDGKIGYTEFRALPRYWDHTGYPPPNR